MRAATSSDPNLLQCLRQLTCIPLPNSPIFRPDHSISSTTLPSFSIVSSDVLSSMLFFCYCFPLFFWYLCFLFFSGIFLFFLIFVTHVPISIPSPSLRLGPRHRPFCTPRSPVPYARCVVNISARLVCLPSSISALFATPSHPNGKQSVLR